jgi:cytochrome c-type biogenesis protein
LGLPFLLVGLGVQRLVGAFGWVQRNYKAISIVSGGLMIAVGVLLFTGAFTRLFAPLSRFAPGL